MDWRPTVFEILKEVIWPTLIRTAFAVALGTLIGMMINGLTEASGKEITRRDRAITESKLIVRELANGFPPMNSGVRQAIEQILLIRISLIRNAPSALPAASTRTPRASTRRPAKAEH